MCVTVGLESDMCRSGEAAKQLVRAVFRLEARGNARRTCKSVMPSMRRNRIGNMILIMSGVPYESPERDQRSKSTA
eukprot:4791136-Amphidinium_carterae.1